ncbi:MAG: M48 family metalloprotease [Okeania sp. SIO2G4]|uniref:M48 family metallopeptidase n=1 Tax=unclassified Okeania TaxID=2634635 RepID=UPI0013B7B75B|nr:MULTISPECIES: M48 family metallopeptidase [unclassified Okeania]NEP74958.1 M48 family metalloprotease [Okeania sp. SIO2G5]NEP92835.1 M48 family metalloprotease [Okeania sp. SIO2F5]NEQ93774.1 M48 family metalloprotease [Okeania sp. SIO2G4]
MLKIKTILAILAVATFLLPSNQLSVKANPTSSENSTPTEQTKDTEQPKNIYEQAKQELPDDLYTLYRIVDRIARANGLDEKPWRIIIFPKYEINAFATEVNLIAMYNGILDQLVGDASAIACIVAHEMAHHTERHIALAPVEKLALIEKIEQEAQQEVLAEKQDAQAEATGTSIGGTAARVFGGRAGRVGGAVLGNASRQRTKASQEKINEIVAQKKEELEQTLAEEGRKRELEADEKGYLYSAKAGFEPEGCLRAMNVLLQTPSAEFDTTHPAVPKRIEALKDLMVKSPATSLVEEAKALISQTEPLSYDFSKDGASLRVNSSRGGSSADDIERLFDY